MGACVAGMPPAGRCRRAARAAPTRRTGGADSRHRRDRPAAAHPGPTRAELNLPGRMFRRERTHRLRHVQPGREAQAHTWLRVVTFGSGAGLVLRGPRASTPHRHSRPRRECGAARDLRGARPPSGTEQPRHPECVVLPGRPRADRVLGRTAAHVRLSRSDRRVGGQRPAAHSSVVTADTTGLHELATFMLAGAPVFLVLTIADRSLRRVVRQSQPT